MNRHFKMTRVLSIALLGLFALGCEDNSSKPSKEQVFRVIRTNHVVFSPDGMTLLSEDNDLMRLWDVKTHKLLWSGRGPGTHSQFLPDGKRIASFRDFDLVFWDVQTRQINETKSLVGEEKYQGFPVAYTPDFQRVIGVGELQDRERRIRVWDLKENAVIKEFFVSCIDSPYCWSGLSRDGKVLWLASRESGLLHEVDIEKGLAETRAALAPTQTGCFLFSSPMRFLAFHKQHSQLCTYELPVGTPTVIGTHEDDLMAVAATADGRLLLSAGNQQLKLRAVEPPRLLWTVDVPKGPNGYPIVMVVAISPDNKLAAVGGGMGERPSRPTLYLIDMETGEVVATLLKG